MTSLQPYLAFGAVEVANALRTLTYLRRLPDPRLRILLADTIQTGPGYENAYGDTYTADYYSPLNLGCYCAAFDGGPYVSPQTDPAPWFDASQPASREFLGLLPVTVELSPSAARSLLQHSRGARLGALTRLGLICELEGVLWASSARGLAWGEAWLRRTLAGSEEGCVPVDVPLYPWCPGDGETADGVRRYLSRAAMIEAPRFEAIQQIGGTCVAERVSFAVGAEVPWLIGEPVACVTAQPLQSMPVATCLIEASRGLETGVKIELDAGVIGSTVAGVIIKATPTSGACPTADTADTISYTVDRLERGNRLTIDGARRVGYVEDRETTTAPVGIDALDFSGLLEWFEMQPGEKLCVTVDATSASNVNPGTTVSIWHEDRQS